MNNFQNNSRKFVRPLKTSPDHDQTPRKVEQDKKKREECGNDFDKWRPSGALKIFFESESLKRAEVRKKDPVDRDERSITNEKLKAKKERKKNRKPKNVLKKYYKKRDCFKPEETKDEVAIPKTQNKVETRELDIQDELKKVLEITEKHGKSTKEETSLAHLNSLFTLRKENKDTAKKPDLHEICATPLTSLFCQKSSTNTINKWGQTSSSKISRKASQISKTSEVKMTISEYKKNRINEILKGHAQKVQASPSTPNEVQGKTNQQNKEYSFQGVTDLLQRAKNISNLVSTNKESNAKESGNNEILTGKQKSEESKRKSAKESEDTKEIVSSDDGGEDKKNLARKLLKFPQSNDLERRLKGLWLEPGFLFPQTTDVKAQEVGGIEEDERSRKSEEKSEKCSDQPNQEEKKREKKVPFIDRLLLTKLEGKEKGEQKIETDGELCESLRKEDNHFEKKAEDEEKKGVVVKKIETLINFRPIEPKPGMEGVVNEITSSEITELLSPKDDMEQIFKTKPTRSMELRDLVTQAVKEHKIFCIFDNHWYIVRPVREELLSRGWLEVIPDRRLIPRRRPPPTGPTYDREKTAADHTLEAILTAKETFANEIEETVSKSSLFRTSISKQKSFPFATSNTTKKLSDDSLNEAPSQFRIIPPTAEKKKNNIEIREFTTKYKAWVDKCNEKDKKGKDKRPRTGKKERNSKTPEKTSEKSKQVEKSKNAADASSTVGQLSKSLQPILKVINENKKIIRAVANDYKNLDIKNPGADILETVCSATENAEVPAESGETEKKEKTEESAVSLKNLFTESEAKMISKIIQSMNSRIHFMWLSVKPSIHLKCFNYCPEIVNKFQKTTFCTKIGLWNHLNNMQWYAHEVHFPAKSPRMYNTGESDDLQAFFQDFQLTACIGLLKWLSDTFFDKGMKAVQTKKGKVPLKAFEFAIKQCERYIRFRDNEDLGVSEEPSVHQNEWNIFLQWFYIITNDHGKIQETSSAQLMVVYTKAVDTLKTMKRHWPEIDIDGRLNIWIMKPYCASCGRGIFMTNNVYYIGQHSKYIVQKYIEKPLLIYNTKFDIRQWFLITKLTPLEIWMYKECYLRFCTQPFALRNLHESVHLSNNSVQRKYISSSRDPTFPDQNMWDSSTFQLYLKTIGHPNTWQDIIYPGMRDAIVSTMLAAQETFDGPRRSWFEIYGADFMISANPKDGPWLIEINENPAMDPSTKVTARLCPQMLRDVIKVVVDKRNNKNACTGQWELVYRQNYSPSFGIVDLDVRGKRIAKIPQNVKVNLNFPQHLSTTQMNEKRHVVQDTDISKLYKVVKSYGSGQNNKRDPSNIFSSSNVKSKDTDKVTRVQKDMQVKPSELNNASKVNKEKMERNVRSLVEVEDKPRSNQIKSKEESKESEKSKENGSDKGRKLCK